MSKIRLVAPFFCTACFLSACATTKDPTITSIEGSPYANLYDGNSTALYATQMPVSSPAEAIALGDTALGSGELELALFQYVRALELDDSNAETFFKIGAIHQQRGSTTLAGIAFSSALKVNPNHAGANEALGLVYLNQRNYAAASKYLKKAVSIDQSRWKSHNALGVISDLQKDYTSAIGHYRAALSANPRSASIHNNVGYSHYLAGNWKQAIADFRRALDVDPTYERAWRNLGLTYARQGQYSKALDALKRTESEAEAYNDVGYISMTQGKYDRATYFLEEAIEMSPTYYQTAHSNLERVRSMNRAR